MITRLRTNAKQVKDYAVLCERHARKAIELDDGTAVRNDVDFMYAHQHRQIASYYATQAFALAGKR